MSTNDEHAAGVPPPDARPARAGPRRSVVGVLVVLIAAATYGVAAVDRFIPSGTERELAAFTPSSDRPDPSTAIPGIVLQQFAGGEHVTTPDAIAYNARPPYGGPHGLGRAACDGVVYPQPVRDADAVHALEHGAVWITYDPARTPASTLEPLTRRVINDSSLLMSPYPGLDTQVSLQAWGHRLALNTPEDPRFEQFLQALRANPYTPPEPNGGCGGR